MMVRKIRKDQRGATILEFAIVAPVLFLFLFGIIEFSLVLFVSSVIEGATSGVARMMKTGDPMTSQTANMQWIRNYILNRGAGFITPTNLHITVTNLSAGGALDDVGSGRSWVRYSVGYDWILMTPLIAQIISPEDGVFHVASETVVCNETF